jgi:hypothetical protein
MVDAWPLAIEFAGHEPRIVAGMKLLPAAHFRCARLRPGNIRSLMSAPSKGKPWQPRCAARRSEASPI